MLSQFDGWSSGRGPLELKRPSIERCPPEREVTEATGDRVVEQQKAAATDAVGRSSSGAATVGQRHGAMTELTAVETEGRGAKQQGEAELAAVKSEGGGAKPRR